jgi:hypothetical protein
VAGVVEAACDGRIGGAARERDEIDEGRPTTIHTTIVEQ